MSKIQIFSKILGSIGDLKKYILDNLSKAINKTLFTNLNTIEKNISSIIIQSIKQQPEYTSLKSGILRHEFGLANTGVVDAILAELENIQIKIIRPNVKGDAIEASFIINMIKSNFEDILSSSYASYTTEKGSNIEWLRWLLVEGHNSVVIGYKYIPKISPRSRTSKGIMINSESSVYRVSPQFAGTIEDNWITRGLDDALPEIQAYINRTVEQSL
jgi:hypothetical protein